MYDEEEYLQLSGIQHFAFCRRQWALAYMELQWAENVRTVEGKLLHEKAHDVMSREKRGAPKQNHVDVLQLAAQAMCLEEMLCCDIPEGYLYYGETRHRERVELCEAVRQEVRDMLQEMHGYFSRKYTPRVKWSKGCNACSLRDICLPVLGKGKSAEKYVETHIAEEN